MYLLQIVKNIFLLLPPEQKSRMLLLQVFFIFSAIVQVVGVASIAPFIGILSNPASIHTNHFLSFLYQVLQCDTDQAFVTRFALASIAMIFLSNLTSALTLWLLLKFAISLGSNLQFKLYENFLNRTYIFHKNINSTQLISIISQEAPRFVYMVLQPYLLLCSNAFIALAILGGLLFLNPVIALASGAIIGGAYMITYWWIKKSLIRNGRTITERNEAIQGILAESFIGIKDIKLNSLEKQYTELYKTTNFSGLNSSAFITLAGDLPKFAIETISFSAILLFAIVLLSISGHDEGLISILSVYAIAGYKLLPTMQQIYKSISSMSANGGVVAELKAHLDEKVEKKETTHYEPLNKIDQLDLQKISFQYPTSKGLILNNVDLSFRIGQLNTIAGPSGSGKSTLADIILGLLKPESGKIFIDQQELTGVQFKRYQQSIGYVPQHIFILDDSVIANVAFGVERSQVNLAKVEQALRMANAYEFVNVLPNGLNTRLGQDGKLLSGGQRQRIGIARTLYRDNKILILDEPTSALDIESEYDLMTLLGNLKEAVLIIVISHRPAAIKLSDQIILIDQGKVTANGSFNDLMRSNKSFQELMDKGFMG